jgi:(p)ppGpp synthase/HD superfamily hydrolase
MRNTENCWDREKYLKAWNFASIHHSGQKYGGHEQDQYIDYLTHIGMVAMEIIWALQNSEKTYDADLAIQCAILHDIIEDTGVGFESLSVEFGEKVANGVLALTKDKHLETKDLQMADSLKRIKMQDPEIWMVKMADRISNLFGAPFYWDAEKTEKYKLEAQSIYNSLSEANPVLAKRLKLKIDEY